MSRVRFLIFLGKEGQNVSGRGHLKGADILTGRAGTTSRASTAETPPILLSESVSRFHLGTAWRRGNTF